MSRDVTYRDDRSKNFPWQKLIFVQGTVCRTRESGLSNVLCAREPVASQYLCLIRSLPSLLVPPSVSDSADDKPTIRSRMPPKCPTNPAKSSLETRIVDNFAIQLKSRRIWHAPRRYCSSAIITVAIVFRCDARLNYRLVNDETTASTVRVTGKKNQTQKPAIHVVNNSSDRTPPYPLRVSSRPI